MLAPVINTLCALAASHSMHEAILLCEWAFSVLHWLLPSHAIGLQTNCIVTVLGHHGRGCQISMCMPYGPCPRALTFL